MPSSRARKRANGISSCESGKKKIDLPASRSRCRAPGLGEQHPRVRADRRQGLRATRREEVHRAHAERVEHAAELVFDHVGQRADDQQRRRRIGGGLRQRGHHRREAGVLALGEGGLDAAARIRQHAHAGVMLARQALRGARQVELDHLGRAGADQEQQLDVGPAREQFVDHAVELVVGIGEAREVALLDHRGAEARLGEDHHAGGRLHQVRAGARAHDQEERVLHLAVHPDDAGQPAEHLALAALAQHRHLGAAAGVGARFDGGTGVHSATAMPPGSDAPPAARSSSLAARSFSRNCAALTT